MIKEKLFQILLKREFSVEKNISTLKRKYKEILLEQYDIKYVNEQIRKINNFTDIISELIRRIYDDSKLYCMFENSELNFKEDSFNLKEYIDTKIHELTHKNIFIHDNQQEEIRNIILDIIMYKIINDKKTRMNSQRGMLFAKEFGKDIDIPFTYGIRSYDAWDFEFINTYLNNGGRITKKFFINFFSNKDIEYISIHDYIKKYIIQNNCNTKNKRLSLKKNTDK